MSDSTAVFVHASRYPLCVLKKLVQAESSGSSSSPSYVRRLHPLFRYEAGVDPVSAASTSTSKSYERSKTTKSSSAAASGKGKAREIDSPSGGDNNEEELLNPREIFTYESPIEGNVCEWCAEEGAVLTDPNIPILRILEPCKHPVQLGGLCAVCGKDLTGTDYTGFSETSRANISMSHDTASLTVSLEEASRIEKQTSARLLKEKKLSLIVDLDQTVIQATVDPTVGDWMFDEKNPNYPVLQDCERFRLTNEMGQEEGCYYYVKPRPTLTNFLEQASKLYEMHVYTMGTRAYAECVCKIIDPSRKIFANRILSRDESGSLSHKSLQRLFPVDQSMVVIIDDRGDVWDWCPNLVKVVPFEFFPGMGDINSAFLPKLRAISSGTSEASSSSSSPATAGSTKPSIPSTATSDLTAAETAAAITAQAEDMGHQIAEKPLAKLQEEKTAMLQEKAAKTASDSSSPPPSSQSQPPDGDVVVPPAHAEGTDQPKHAQPVSLVAEAKPAASAVPSPPNRTNGIGASRFVSKMQTDDASDSEDDTSSSDEETVAKESKPAEAVRSTTPSAAPPAADIPVIIEQAAEAEGQPDGTSEVPDESQPMSEDLASSQIDAEEEAVLRDDDRELERVLGVLSDVHREYYDTKDNDRNVEYIIPRMKGQVLAGCNIVFSGVIPLDQDTTKAEIWRLALQFGANCSNVLQNRTTHVVAAKTGTSKVNQARRRKGVHIVTPSWLDDSIASWHRESEEDYALAPDAGDSQETDAQTPTSFQDSPAREPPDQNGAADDDMEDELDGDASLHVDWGDAAAEVEALLDETDEDDDGMASGTNTADESDADSVASGAAGNRKRPRNSPRKSAAGSTGSTESPLAKRRKVAAARAGQSKLKMSESIDAIDAGTTVSSSTASQTSSPAVRSKDGEADGTASSDDELDDFAKALEGELS